MTLLFTLFALLLFSQEKKVTIDLNNLDMGNISPNSVYIQSNKGYRVSDSKELTINVKQLPSLIKLSILKRHRFQTQKLFWIEKEDVKIEGFLENKETLVILPQSNFQSIADKILQLKKYDSEAENNLAFTKPYLVHLERNKGYHKQEYIKRIVTNLPDSLKGFWAAKLLRIYLLDFDKIAYDRLENKISYLSAINRNNEAQSIKFPADKYLLLDFSAPGCPPCLTGIDGLVAFNTKYNEKLDIVMLWKGLTYEDWLGYAKKHQSKITFSNLLDKNGSIFKTMEINVFPTYMLFNPDGILVKKWRGKLPKNISKYLN